MGLYQTRLVQFWQKKNKQLLCTTSTYGSLTSVDIMAQFNVLQLGIDSLLRIMLLVQCTYYFLNCFFFFFVDFGRWTLN